MGKSKVGRMSAGARCAPLQRGRNRNDEMHLQRWVLSLQRLDAFATDGCTAVPCRGAHCAPVRPRRYNNNPSRGRAKGYRGDRRHSASSRFSLPKDLPLRGRGTARGGGRSPSPVGARIACPFVPDVIATTLREGARRVIGATAKPLYPIDVKAAGLDRRNPLNPRQGLKQVHFIFLAWNDSFCAEPMI